MSIRQISVNEFRAELLAQGVTASRHLAVKCPMCGTVQSMADFVSAGLSPAEAEKYIAFSCIGRFTGAGSPRKKPDGKPCNWTLGGLFKTHRLEVIDEDGVVHPRFEPASPEEAQAHEARNREAAK